MTTPRVELWHETFGSPRDEALLLHMGAGLQGPYWPTELCEALAARNRFVIRFDARDVGLSTKLDALPGDPAVLRGTAPYLIQDMARDALGLLDSLSIERAHILGASLGAAVAESMAILAPDRVGAITMYNGLPAYTRADALAFWDALVSFPVLDDPVEHAMAGARAAAGPAYPFEEDRLCALWSSLVGRSWYPPGVWRQTACALFSPRPGARALAATGVPVTVVQGTADPGCDGMLTYARALPGARVIMLDGVGHELPSGVWDRLVDAVEHTPIGSRHS